MKYWIAIPIVLLLALAGIVAWRMRAVAPSGDAPSGGGDAPSPPPPALNRPIIAKTANGFLGMKMKGGAKDGNVVDGILLEADGSSGNTHFLNVNIGDPVILEGWPSINVRDNSPEAYATNTINVSLNGTHRIIGKVGQAGKVIAIVINKQWENNHTLFRDAKGKVVTLASASSASTGNVITTR